MKLATDHLLTQQQTVQFAAKHGFKPNTTDSVWQQLLAAKEWLRTKHKVHIENGQDERGSMNHKTQEYFTCEITRREPNPNIKGQKYISKISHKTFSNYEDAVHHGVVWAIEHKVKNGSLQEFLDLLHGTSYAKMK